MNTVIINFGIASEKVSIRKLLDAADAYFEKTFDYRFVDIDQFEISYHGVAPQRVTAYTMQFDQELYGIRINSITVENP